MKIRNGFVSNSSSSSFVVLLPEGFTPEDIDWDANANHLEDQEMSVEEGKEAVQNLLRKGEAWEEEDGWFVLGDVLEDYIIAEMAAGPDAGMVVVADRVLIKEKL